MRSWGVLLFPACCWLLCASAQGDPLPRALVELVQSSSINSIEDLRRLLLTDSVEDDPDSPASGGALSNSTFSRLPRSLMLEAEPAVQAQCKVRTEVMAITRGMVDRRNANFLVWPPCVEVQRCSGCCSLRGQRCLPTAVHLRHLQVVKIEYVNKKTNYGRAVVSVEDHLACRCASTADVPRAAPREPQHQARPRQPESRQPETPQPHHHQHQKQQQEQTQPQHHDPHHPPEEVYRQPPEEEQHLHRQQAEEHHRHQKLQHKEQQQQLEEEQHLHRRQPEEHHRHQKQQHQEQQQQPEEHHKQQHHQDQQHPSNRTTTHRPGTAAPPATPPPARQRARRPHRKRQRKTRHGLTKAAMRALLL
nr:PREDICTED: platelet-derived growth factor subunit B-like [Lepisosteus oculatus]